MQKGKECLMVGGLNGWYGVEANALVGAVQILVVHAESGGSRDAQPGEVVADVGRSWVLRPWLQG
jgi:hypothetical protein